MRVEFILNKTIKFLMVGIIESSSIMIYFVSFILSIYKNRYLKITLIINLEFSILQKKEIILISQIISVVSNKININLDTLKILNENIYFSFKFYLDFDINSFTI